MAAMDEGIAGFIAGDEAAVRAVYQRYGGAVHTIARSLVADPELAKEVVQQTFLKAWKSSGTFDQSREFAPWLYSIARRSAIDVLRREGRPTQGDHEPEVDVAVSDGGYGSVSFEQTWEVHEVRQAIDELPEVERDTIRLSHLEGFSHPEIAARLGVPIGTVKSRSARAHSRLASSLRHIAKSANRIQVHNVQKGEE